MIGDVSGHAQTAVALVAYALGPYSLPEDLLDAEEAARVAEYVGAALD